MGVVPQIFTIAGAPREILPEELTITMIVATILTVIAAPIAEII